MASVVINGDTSGSVTLQAPAAAGATVLTLPSTSGTVLTTASGQWITSGSDIYYNTGNVGIGTTSPNGKLGVVTATSATAFNSNNNLNTGFQVNYVSGLTSIGNNFNNPLAFITNNTEYMRIDSSGNVGIGTTSPVGRITSTVTNISTVTNTLTLDNAGGGGGSGVALNFYASNTSQPFTGRINSLDDGNFGYHTVFSNKPGGSAGAAALTERMRIDSGGNLLIGTTSSYGFGNLQLESTAGTISIRNSAAAAGRYWRIGPDTSSSNFVVYNQSGTGVFLASGGTSWTSSSDETLKENLEPITDAINKINTLRAVTGNFITDEEKKKHPFLIAQDVEKVLPEAISESSDGTLGLAYTDVIPLLTAAIQEQQTIINDLKARIETLETK